MQLIILIISAICIEGISGVFIEHSKNYVRFCWIGVTMLSICSLLKVWG